MLLRELLLETTEEDRAIISLSSSVYDYVQQYKTIDLSSKPNENLVIGKIGELFNTPINILDNVTLELQTGKPFLKRASPDNTNEDAKVFGMWDADTQSIVLNASYMDTHRMKTIITHELRHALDDYKSSFKTADETGYTAPRKRDHKKDPGSMLYYNARRDEINARFTEVLDILAKRIPKWFGKLSPVDAKKQIDVDFDNLLVKYEIAYLFPEKSKSYDYRRLMKRGHDFIQKEITYIESKL